MTMTPEETIGEAIGVAYAKDPVLTEGETKELRKALLDATEGYQKALTIVDHYLRIALERTDDLVACDWCQKKVDIADALILLIPEPEGDEPDGYACKPCVEAENLRINEAQHAVTDEINGF